MPLCTRRLLGLLFLGLLLLVFLQQAERCLHDIRSLLPLRRDVVLVLSIGRVECSCFVAMLLLLLQGQASLAELAEGGHG